MPFQLLAAKADSKLDSSWMITRIKMFDAKNGWCLSNFEERSSIMRTTDGAKHWVKVSPKSYSPLFDNDDADQQSVGTFFLSSQSAWVAQVVPYKGAQMIYAYHTGSGGRTWTATHFVVSKKPGNEEIFSCNTSIDFVDSEHGFILLAFNTSEQELQYKAIYTTSDGGRAWTAVTGDQHPPSQQPHSLPSFGDMTGFNFSNPTSGWVTTQFNYHHDSSLYHSSDGGKSWRFSPLPHSSLVQPMDYNLDFPPVFFGKEQRDGIMLMIFLDSQGNSHVLTYSSLNSGDKWSAPVTSSLGNIGSPVYDFCDPSHGWIWDSDGNKLYSTSNAGHQWKLLRSNPIGREFYNPLQLDFVTPERGWAIGQPEISLVKVKNSYLVTGKWTSLLFKTNDGGRTWTKQNFTLQ
jgi:photosystem II stability/assembly factor-like uncharacterized protein